MKNKNILIVDKDPSIISIFEFSLQDKGFHIFKLDYQIDSYPVLPSSIPNLDLIFIDQTIHINPSIEALDCVKAQYGDVPIILMAVSNLDTIFQEAFSKGIYGILYKPLNPEEVIHIIKKI